MGRNNRGDISTHSLVRQAQLLGIRPVRVKKGHLYEVWQLAYNEQISCAADQDRFFWMASNHKTETATVEVCSWSDFFRNGKRPHKTLEWACKSAMRISVT